jgi:carbonic anhydrase
MRARRAPSFRSVGLPFVVLVVAPIACGEAPPPGARAAEPSPAPSAAATTSHAHWSYSGDEGPERWGSLDPSYTLCSTGAHQSPIDLPQTPSRRGPPPARPQWDPVPLQLKNNGHTIQVDDTAPSSLVVDGTTYRLQQFHFHSPAEHAIGGHTYAAEMHLVHKSDAGKLLVVAILFASGAENATLAPVWSAMPERGAPAVVVPGKTIDIASLLPSAPRYFRYDGSLTTPPCTEGVTWLVVEPEASAQISPEQIRVLHAHTEPSTRRPLQLGGREVLELLP